VARQAQGPRAGYDRRSIREPLAALAYDRRFAVDRALHAVDRNRRLAAAALGYSLDGLPLDYGLAGLATEAGSSGAAPEAILLTATSRDDKLWAENRWIELGRGLAERGMVCVLPSGSAVERERAERLAQAIPNAIALPPSAIRALAVRIAGARCAIGVDTGLTHLACGTGIPTVAIYTATDPGLTGVVGAGFHRNLGGKDASPSVDAVRDALAEAGVL
jgi:heptosyltransferase-1